MNRFTTSEKKFMRSAIRLAEKGLGFTSPNPAVGAIIVNAGQVVGRGYHKRAGDAHAEVNAIRDAGQRCKGAEIFVTLEPCNHTGKTPPCTKAILEAGLRRVVIGALDPNPSVKGGGADFLRSQGIRVDIGLLESECKRLLAPFAKSIKRGIPWIRAKTACSLDGRIATRTGHSQWITNDKARQYGQELRKMSDAIVVGKGTVLADDPSLTWRPRRPSPGQKKLLRVILDSRLECPTDAKLFSPSDSSPTMVVSTMPDVEKRRILEKKGVEVVELPPNSMGRPHPGSLLELLGRKEVQSVLVEGGAEVLGCFYDNDLVDEAFFFFAPLIIGGTGAKPAIGGMGTDVLTNAKRLKGVTITHLGDNWLVRGIISDLDSLWSK